MLKALFGSLLDSNEKALGRLRPLVQRINALEPELQALSNEELGAKTADFKARLANGDTVDDILPEAFAAVREAAKRTIGQRHFDVQLMGGIVLHKGKIAEMKTGEGKTLVATLPAYLNALTGKGVHIVTVNDYLARRDPHWMGPVYHLLGVSVASIYHDSSYVYDPEHESGDAAWSHLRRVTRREAYQADIAYGTNSEFGFDYLRDNMVLDTSQCSQRPLNYAIVDEVDNILIDEARTPLIISGQAEESAELYKTFAHLVPRLHGEDDYVLDEKTRSVSLTEVGIGKVERLLNVANLYDPENYHLAHYLDNAVKAHVLYQRDRDYVVKDGQVIIVDEFTGRLMWGRRYSEGLHQAIEAKEGVPVQRESITLATITFQNYFRMYQKLAGMTGTAATEAEEFAKIYKLDVMIIPTNKPLIRTEHADRVYKSEEAKFKAAADEIEEWYKQTRPVLVGTVTIEKSERLSALLQRRGIAHQVLNAKLHEKEAGIVAQAGRLGAVTIATNMAGRGTDIILGGNPEGRDQEDWKKEHEAVVALGGLHIVGTEHHEARRIDNQLRGRAGRQGDPGSSRFYASLEDDLLKRFGGDRLKGLLDWAGLPDDEPIEHSWVTKALENSQVKFEAYNFDIRKHLVEYDDVVNTQRDVIYSERRKIISGADLKANILGMVHEALEGMVGTFVQGKDSEAWDLTGLVAAVGAIFPVPEAPEKLAKLSRDEISQQLRAWADERYEAKEAELTPENMRAAERLVMLQVLDNLWVQHLTAMESMRHGIGLRAIAQQDPLVAFKREASLMFQGMLDTLKHDIGHTIYHVALAKKEEPAKAPVGAATKAMAAAATGASSGRSAMPAQSAHANDKIGRNDPCPCGSGKKYKKCHGRAA